MGSGWMKSVQCKSRVLDDVALINKYNKPYPKQILSTSTCRRTAQTLKDVVVLHSKTKQQNPSNKPKSNKKTSQPCTNTRETLSYRRSLPDQELTSLTELPNGHPSRNVVEIIFHTSWGSYYYNSKPFSGRVEVVFKVQNPQWTISRFEDYRLKVKSRVAGASAEDDARCAADGNEMMRFHCLGPTVECPGAGAWGFPKGVGLCTFSWSGRAHESAGAGEKERRAMVVCRVIAGRVSKRFRPEGIAGFDSATGDNGELVVFDPRAVLPCFFVIYKL